MLQQFQRKIILARNLRYGVDIIMFNLYKSNFKLVILQIPVRESAKIEFICILNLHLSHLLTHIYNDTIHAQLTSLDKRLYVSFHISCGTKPHLPNTVKTQHSCKIVPSESSALFQS